MIAELRTRAHGYSEEVLAKAMKQLAAGQPAEQVLEFLAHTLTNKFLHLPSTCLRSADESERHILIQSARKLFIEAGSRDAAQNTAAPCKDND